MANTVRNENETHIQDGKIAGDTVKGKVESNWSGDWQTLVCEGTRGK